ncbi:MAG: 2-oxoacid:acceptor oxidoreductase subunit alpha, partial [Candidatus Korarchaeota archaeon]|nr:2-oxoacid:acceptor oxidoreductase subunit alpha [Candidatus Korarchaeota archaeon]
MTLKPGTYFMSGNEAIAEGAIMAGCRFFAGYPITPSSEIAERLARRLPQVGGIFIQMEDELASMIAIIGASWGGLKAMTATSGPGFSLMQENLGFAVMTETPVVVVDVQRGSPSTGLPTLIGQGDIMQAKWGSHGPYEIIALSPSTVQECFDFAIKAFNLAEKYRVPVIVLMDERISHLYEKVVVPPKEKLILVERKRPKSKENFLPYKAEDDLIPPMPPVGEGYHFHITGLTHDERGYPKIDAETH